MQILLTNDDGIYAPGIAVLKHQIQDLGQITVVAPDIEQSGVGHSITFSHPLRIREVRLNNEFIGYGVNGSPADCVKLAVYEIMKKDLGDIEKFLKEVGQYLQKKEIKK